ncbi:MAG: hypothetical protein ACYCS7_13155 [Acidimicrobiales bacterium]
MSSLADKVLAVHDALGAAGLPHAFGGALALAWCTRAPRGTSDIDVNIFVAPSSVGLVLEALPAPVTHRRDEVLRLERDGQARLHWDSTPIDIFLNTTGFHEAAMARTSLEPFAGAMVPFLACSDLVVFKALFNRRRDWADIEDMLVAGSISTDAAAAVLGEYLGPGDARIAQLLAIEQEVGGSR